MFLLARPQDAVPRTGTVAAVRVYVAAIGPEGMEAPDDLLRCADSVKRALTPSLGTLIPAHRRGDADMVVEVKKCAVDAGENGGLNQSY